MANNLEYTSIDYDQIVNDLVERLRRTDSFKDFDYAGSFIRTLVELIAHVGSLNSYYVNAAANEVYVPTAKLYKNLNKISSLVNYSPRGRRSAQLDVVLELDRDYVFGREERTIEIPSYSLIQSEETDEDGNTISFTNETDQIYRIKGFGLQSIDGDHIMYDDTPIDELIRSSSGLNARAISIDTNILKPLVVLDNELNQEEIVRDTVDCVSDVDIEPDTEYSLRYNGDSEQNLSLVVATDNIPDSEIVKLKFSSTDQKFVITQNNAEQSFYVGYMGVKNLDSIQTVLTTSGTTITRYGIRVQEGQPPLRVLIDGEVYSWSYDDTNAPSGNPIWSRNYEDGDFLGLNSDLNILLKVSGNSTGNFSSEILITTDDPGVDEVVLATIPQSQINEDGNLTTNNLAEIWQHIPETIKIPDTKQGTPKRTILFEDGSVSADVDELDLTYLPSSERYVVENTDISTEDLRVFVKSGTQIEEWKQTTQTQEVGPEDKVFYTRTNPQQKAEIWFGDDDYGMDPTGSRIVIIGLDSAGSDGNIRSNNLSGTITITGFSGRLFKTQTNLSGGINSSTIIQDSDGDTVQYDIKQGYAATGGAEPEDTEELRKNIPRAIRSQETLVSAQDYNDYIMQEFGDQLADVETVNYEEANQLGLIDENFERYFFNTLFIVVVPQVGNTVLEYQKDNILDTVNNQFRSLLTTSHLIIDADLIPIDVLVQYTRESGVTRTKSTIEASIENNLTMWFDRSKRSIGETLEHSTIVSQCLVEGVRSVEVMLNTDENDEYESTDYDKDISADEYSSDEGREATKQAFLRELEESGLLKKYQPLFDVEKIVNKTTGATEREWTQSNNIKLSQFAFPVLGDIVLEERTQ